MLRTNRCRRAACLLVPPCISCLSRIHLRAFKLPHSRHGHTNRLTVRWGPAKRGETAKPSQARRLCRPPEQSAGVASPLCPSAFLGVFWENSKQNGENHCGTRDANFAFALFLFSLFFAYFALGVAKPVNPLILCEIKRMSHDTLRK